MPSGVGFELIVVGALVAILVAAGTVARLRKTEQAPAEPPSSDILARLIKAPSPGGDPREVVEEVGRVFNGDPSLSLAGRPAVVMVVGANGSGRTTMAGKIAHRLVNKGRLVALTAVDTFRLAAVHQLASWAERAGADLIAVEGATDPGAAAYEAVDAARARGSDVLIVDATGRLGAHETLMDDLARVRRVLEQAAGQVDEVLLVLDVRTSQNVITEAKQFVDAVGVTGLALSNLDRWEDPKIVLAVVEELRVPVKMVGTGADIEDLRSFDADWYARILVGDEGEGGVLTRESLPASFEKPPSAAES